MDLFYVFVAVAWRLLSEGLMLEKVFPPRFVLRFNGGLHVLFCQVFRSVDRLDVGHLSVDLLLQPVVAAWSDMCVFVHHTFAKLHNHV